MLPEEKARVKIDELLKEAGWTIVNRNEIDASVSAVAVREGLLNNNLEADYLLFIDGKIVGVLEAKREESDLDKIVQEQAENYTKEIPSYYATWEKPLPLIYLSNGKRILFKNNRKTGSSYEEISKMHSPYKMIKDLNLDSFWGGLPVLEKKTLRDCQFEAVQNVEKSFKNENKKALMVLATGSGKTFTACMMSYRLLEYTPMHRVLFLVDRNNLGTNAYNEFAKFKLTQNGQIFTNIFNVTKLTAHADIQSSNVVISTIQRLFAKLTGKEIEENDDVEDDLNNLEENRNEPEIVLGNDLKLSSDFFDLIIVDECHRSIYGKWKSVLNYFSSAKVVGLTATPLQETVAFFDNNQVANYTFEQSVVDGVNVDSRIYRIRTKISEQGTILHEQDIYTEHSKYKYEEKKDVSKVAETEVAFDSGKLNRAVIDKDQIRTVMQEYKKAIYEQLYPEREADYNYIPKTLIFAETDKHADEIISVIKEVFDDECKNNSEFVKKITCKAEGKSDDLIKQFNNDKKFRIAVTVTLVATGTDVKALEIVMFLRDVASQSLYIQMKGRGCRTISDDVLRERTPNAISKDCYYIIDCVGVTEHEKMDKPKDNDGEGEVLHLKEILEKITLGYIPDDYLHNLAGKISRIVNKSSTDSMIEFEEQAGITLKDLATRIYNFLNTEQLFPFEDVNAPNLERKNLVKPLTEHPKARNLLLKLNAGFIKIIDSGDDQVIFSGFSKESAVSTVKSFEDYVRENPDKLEALNLIYNDINEKITRDLLIDLQQKLREHNVLFTTSKLWDAYFVLYPEKVKKLESKNEVDILTNLIQLIRFAYQKTEDLKSLTLYLKRNFSLWVGHCERLMSLTNDQKDLALEIAKRIASNGAYTYPYLLNNDRALASRVFAQYGKEKSAETLSVLSKYILVA